MLDLPLSFSLQQQSLTQLLPLVFQEQVETEGLWSSIGPYKVNYLIYAPASVPGQTVFDISRIMNIRFKLNIL